MIRERFDFRNVSPAARARALQTVAMLNKIDDEKRTLKPLCPDGSGEIGTYNSDASKWFGGIIFATDSAWPKRKYFTWDVMRKKGHVIPTDQIPDQLRV